MDKLASKKVLIEKLASKTSQKLVNKNELDRLQWAVSRAKKGKTYPISRFLQHPVTHGASMLLDPVTGGLSLGGRMQYSRGMLGEKGFGPAFGRTVNSPGRLAAGGAGLGGLAALAVGLARRRPAVGALLTAALAGGGAAAAGGLFGLLNRFSNRRALAGRMHSNSMFDTVADKKLRMSLGSKK